MQADLIKNMEQTGKSKNNTNINVIKKANCHMIQLPDLANQKKTSVYQAQDSESHCDHLDDNPSNNANAGTKRKRAAQLHKLSEKRRRHKKINKRLRALQDLIPNCTKMDKGSVLDEAIQYLKSLQYQLQIMSIFAGLPTQMMLPTYYPPNLQCFTSPFLGYGTTPSMMSPVTRSTQ